MADERYLERFGPTRRDLWLVPASVLFVLAGVLMARDGDVLAGVAAAALGGVYLLLWAVVCLQRRLALLVDERGVTVGTGQPWWSRTAFVPWTDIQVIVLWRQPAGHARMDYLGVLRTAGAPALPGSVQSPVLRTINAAFVPGHLSRDLAADSRPISFWRLDRRRLAAAVARFAPHVPIADEINPARRP